MGSYHDVNSTTTNKMIQLFSKQGHRGKEIKQNKPVKQKGLGIFFK